VVSITNQEIGLKLARDYFTPAFQEAIRQASRDNYRAGDIINGIINAYLHLLQTVFQSDEIVSGLLGAQADHVKKNVSPRYH
jgi:hypothetical protein